VQLTPHNSPASIIFGKGITSAAPGALDGLTLAVADADAALAVHLMTNTAVTGATYDIDGGSLLGLRRSKSSQSRQLIDTKVSTDTKV
jgi:hypothetical protein